MSDPKISDFAFKVILPEGSVPEPVTTLIFENCAPARDILIIIQELRSRARQFDFLDVWIIFVSSEIALPCGASSKFCRFIFIKIDENDAPVRSIRIIWIIYER